jgi:HEAT repeat protein
MTRLLPLRWFLVVLVVTAPCPAFAQHEDPAASARDRAALLERLREAPDAGEDGIRLLEESLRHDDSVVRAAAVQLLWEARGEAAIDAILPLVDDRDDTVVFSVARVLVQCDDPRALEAYRKLMPSLSVNDQVQMITVIADRGNEPFVGELAGLLSRDSVVLRRTAVEALRSIGSSVSFRPCMTATGDADPSVASRAVGCLEVVGDPAALPRLALMAASPQPEVRTAVARSIPALGGIAAHGEVMAKLLKDPTIGVVLAGLDGLRSHPDPAAVEMIGSCLSHSRPRVRRSAVVALRENPSSDVNPLLLRAADDPDEFVRAAAIGAVGARNMDYACEMIAAKAKDTSPTVRTATAIALGELGIESGLASIEVLSRDGDAGVRSTALGAAATIGGSDALVIVRRGLADTQVPVRIAAVLALGRLDSPGSRESLRSTASSAADVNVRVTAINELGRLGDEEAIAVLHEAGKSDAEVVRAAARAALTSIRSR